MLKIECPSCQAPYQLDERRVPTAGLKMRCPKCGNSFLVVNPGNGPARTSFVPAQPNLPPGRMRTPKPTMVGVAEPPPAAAPSSLDLDLEESLLPVVAGPTAAPRRAVEVADLPVVASARPGALGEAQLLAVDWKARSAAVPPAPAPLPAAPAAVAAAPAAPAPAPSRPKPDSGLDLPAPIADLPAMRPRASSSLDHDVRPRANSSLDLSADLPAARADLPAMRARARSSLDHDVRPSANSSLDLPALFADLPAPVGPGLPVVASALPAVAAPPSGAAAPKAALPRIAPPQPVAKPLAFAAAKPGTSTTTTARPPAGGAPPLSTTPRPFSGGALAMPPTRQPASTMGFGDQELPLVFGGPAALPIVPGPAIATVPTKVPPPVAGLEFDDDPAAPLGTPRAPSTPPPAESAPAGDVFGDFGFLDLPEELPAESAPKAGGPSFGELELDLAPPVREPAPSGHARARSKASAPEIGGALGDSELPPMSAPATPRSPSATHAASRGSGLGFGEIDLGSSLDGAIGTADSPSTPMFGRPRAPSGGAIGVEADPFGAAPSAPHAVAMPTSDDGGRAALGGEATLPEPAKKAVAPAPSKLTARRKRMGIAAGAVAAVVIGGGALQLTSYGAFGYLALSDLLHAKSYATTTRALGDETRKHVLQDDFAESRSAVEALDGARIAAPRNRELVSYAAFEAAAFRNRFGVDPRAAWSAATWMSEVPADAKLPYSSAARAAIAADGGDTATAKKLLDQADGELAGDPIATELLLFRGDLALRTRDAGAAQKAFEAAMQKGASPRALFGLARARAAQGDRDGALALLDQTLAKAPQHAMATVLRAWLRFERARDAAEVLAATEPFASPQGRERLAREQQAFTQAVRATALFARGSMSEARAAFDDAVTLDPRSLVALLGQAEMLYVEGRTTEALARFEAAAQVDPSSTFALIGRAKAKIALERLAEAKSELTAARDAGSGGWEILYWLATVEGALGNKGAAEKLMLGAIEKVDTKAHDAVLPYVGLSKLLSASGRGAEAHAKLEEAKAKLPDSSLLQRAFGDVAAEQSKFEKAMVHYDAALTKDPSDLATRFRRGVTLRRMGKLDGAAAELERIAAVDKEYPGVALERGLLFEASGNIEQALEQFRAALRKAPNDPDLQLRVGAALVSVRKPDEAIALLRKVLETRPQSTDAHHFLGRASIMKNGPSDGDGVRELKRAVELDSNRADFHLWVGWAANDAVPWQAGLAQSEIDKALALDKLLAEAHWQKGVIAMRQRAVDDAARDFRKALELKPTLLEVYASIAELQEAKNDNKGALAAWSKAMGASHVRPLWRFQYGKLLVETGRFAEAVKQLTAAIDEAKAVEDHSPWTIRARFFLGEALRKTGQKDAAAEQYRAFLEAAANNAPERSDAIQGLQSVTPGRR